MTKKDIGMPHSSLTQNHEPTLEEDSSSSEPQDRISEVLPDNIRRLEAIFADCSDIVFQHWNYGPDQKYSACSVYYSSLAQENTTNFMKSSLQDLVTYEIGPAAAITPTQIISFFEQGVVSSKKPNLLTDFNMAIEHISAGHLVIFFDEWNKALDFKVLAVETRQVTEPANESVVQGPREATVENLVKNIALLRLRLKTPDFKIKIMDAGGKTKTTVAYGYINGVTDSEMLTEFKRRMEKIKEVDILETSYIEQLIEDSTYTPFPQHRYTERPDVAVAAMLEGKIAVLVQGTGGILLCPGLFTEFFQSSEDYYQRTVYSTMIRWLRIVAFMMALLLPSLYVAFSTFHPELIPTVLLLAIIDAREGLPLPALFEAALMEFFFELLREAGVRLPKPIGSAVSIVGALVIGDAAISAGIASPIMVIIVAATGIASFAIPQYNIAIALRVLRFPLMLSAALLGGFGMMVCLLFMLLHLCRLRTLGQPYLAPLGPLRTGGLRDVLVRMPLRKLLQSSRVHSDP